MDVLLMSLLQLFQKHFNNLRNIFNALPERGYLNRKNVQAILSVSEVSRSNFKSEKMTSNENW